MLTEFRQSKLSPQQLEELQKSTHFDKKELQQWYKGGEQNTLAQKRVWLMYIQDF